MTFGNATGRLASIASAVVIVAVIAGCGSNSSNGNSSNSSSNSGNGSSMATLNTGMNFGDQWVKSLDPAVLPDSLSIDNVNLIEGNLVQTSYPSLKTVPQLASHWTLSKNKKVWTFYINKNAKFSNGDPVTAQDAVWSWTRALTPSEKSTVAMLYMHDMVGAAAVNSGKATTI